MNSIILKKQVHQYNQMCTTLKEICAYMTLAQMKRECKHAGLSYEEYLEMSYENIKLSAKATIQGIRPIKVISVEIEK